MRVIISYEGDLDQIEIGRLGLNDLLLVLFFRFVFCSGSTSFYRSSLDTYVGKWLLLTTQ